MMGEMIAHGTLGIFDELFLLLAIGIFIVMLIAPVALTALRKGKPENPAPVPGEPTEPAGQPDRYRLD
jgi:predicted lipid-binding transport protein (Tim44 family)